MLQKRLMMFWIDLLTATLPCWLVAPLLVALVKSGSPDSDFVLTFVLFVNALIAAVIYVTRPMVLSLTDRHTLGEKASGLRPMYQGQPTSKRRLAAHQGLIGIWIVFCLLGGLYPLVFLPVAAALARKQLVSVFSLATGITWQ